MAVIQESREGARPSLAVFAPGFGEPDRDPRGVIVGRFVGLPGGLLEWSLVPVRLVLAIAVFGLALLVDDMQSARPVWLVVLLTAALYTAVVTYLLTQKRVPVAVATGTVGDIALATLVFPTLYYVASREDPGNLSQVAQPGVALVTLVILTSTLRLKLAPGVLAGAFMTLVPTGLAWLVTADPVPAVGLGGDMLTFAAAAIVFTVLGQAMQRSRQAMANQISRTEAEYEEAERRSSERELLAEISRVVAQSPDLRNTYERFAQAVRTVIPADRIAVNMYDEARDLLTTAYVSGQKVEGWTENASHSPDHTALSTVVRERRSVTLGGDPGGRYDDGPVKSSVHMDFESGVAVPLFHQGGLIGILGMMSNEPRVYGDDSVELLDQIGAQIAPAVANARLYAELQDDARERAVLAEISRILSASPKISEVYNDFVDQLGRLIRWDRVSVNVIDSSTGRLITAYSAGLPIESYPDGEPRPPGNRSVLEHVLRTGKAMFVPDIRDLVEKIPDAEAAVAAGLRSGMYVPLVSDGAVIGTLAVGAREPNAYSPSEFELLERMAAQIAGTFANEELRNQTARQAREESALAAIGRVINSSVGIAEAYEQFAEQVRALMPADRVSIIEVDVARADLHIRYVTGLPIPTSRAGTRRRLHRNGILQTVARSDRGFVFEDLNDELDRFPDARAVAESGVKAAMYSPLRAQGEVIGILCVASENPGVYVDSDFELLQKISAQISGALANALLLEATDRQATEETVLADIARIVNSSLDIEAIYDRFADEARRILDFDRIAITRLGPGEGEYTISHVTGVEIPGLEVGTVWRLDDTPFGPALRNGDTMFIDSHPGGVDNDYSRGMELSEAAGINASLVVPLIQQDHPVGFMSVRSLSAQAFTERDAEVAGRIAALISSAMTNSELLARSNRQADEEATLVEIGRIINSSLDVEEIYAQFADQVKKILPFDRLAIAVRRPGASSFTVAQLVGLPIPGLTVGTTRDIADTNLAAVFEKKETVIQQGGSRSDRVAYVPGESEGLASSVVIPLVSRDDVIGFLALRSRGEEAYDDSQIRLAERVATLASTAIANSQLYERAEAQATERAVMAEIGRIVGSSLDIDSVYDRFTAQLGQLMEFDRISISYVTRTGSPQSSARSASDFQTGFGTARQIPARAFVGTRLGKSIRRRRGAILNESEINEFFDNLPWDNEINALSMICVPLISDGKMVAGLAISSVKADTYDEIDLEVATRVASQIAGAVENALLHGALQEATAELEDTNRQKTELMTNVAHELRSPLTAVNAFMELVLDGAAGDVPQGQHDLLSKAHRSLARMQGILSGFSNLEMAEDARVPLTVTMFDMEGAVLSALELLQPAATHSGIRVNYAATGSLPAIEADREAVGQVISNLISNAIKYTREGGEVSVKCEAADDEIVVSVADTGIGISEEDQERLFERFYRGSDPMKLQIGGNGLGLYVSKSIVERHGGRLWCESELGRGSRFSFALPVEQPDDVPSKNDKVIVI